MTRRYEPTEFVTGPRGDLRLQVIEVLGPRGEYQGRVSYASREAAEERGRGSSHQPGPVREVRHDR